MDKGKYINNEHTTIETLSASIVSLILNEGKVLIPEFGYLELKVFPDKRTVLFKATENAALFLASEGSIQSHIYDNISVPLKEGKVVALPEVGIFRPMKNADGSYRVSYTISSSLRKLLNDTKENATEKPEAVETLIKADDEKTLAPVVKSVVTEQSEDKSEKEEKKEEKEETVRKEAIESRAGYKAAEDNEKAREKVAISTLKREIRVNQKVPSYVRNTSRVGDLVVPQAERKESDATKRKSIAVAGALIALILILMVWYFLPKGKNNNYRDYVSVFGNGKARSTQQVLAESTKSYKSIDLPSLAEQKYGNRMFWVYIYEANRDIISSPVNIPPGTNLRIPNLWEDYKVDVMDSLEIRRAEIKSDEVLKRKIQL